jgi:hypothetical protein
MEPIYILLGVIALIAGLGCSLFVIIEAFRDEVWKGFACFLCWLYLLYFGVAEWEHDYKIPILIGALGGNAIAVGLFRMAGVQG